MAGDILAFGEDRFPIQWSQVLDSKFADQHRGRMRVSRRIPPEIRRESLSWSAHREAASAETIEERIELLDMAVANDWGAREIAEEVRRRRNSRQDNGGPPLDNDNASAGPAGASDTAANNTSGTVNPALPKPLPQAVLACLTEVRKMIYVITFGDQPNPREVLRVCVLTEAVLTELLRQEVTPPATL